MPLKLMYITNNTEVAVIAQKYGVDRIWVDLEILGKEERQRGLNSVKSQHTIDDIKRLKPLLITSEMLVRINHWHDGSEEEIDNVIDAGADIIMLPYWKTTEEVMSFTKAVGGRCKTTLLLETKEAVECIDDVLEQGGFDEIHVGLNDLHLSYGLTFMFELLSNGVVESLCRKFRNAGVPYGFGGIAKLGDGLLPAEKIIAEHYRLGSTRAILSRSFCDVSKMDSIEEIDRVFCENIKILREFESKLTDVNADDFSQNISDIKESVDMIVAKLQNNRYTAS